jgi:hypothetical protein
MLLTIPIELRQKVFKALFRSTIVSHGFNSISTSHTSMLRTSRQLHDEAKPLMAPNISLHFKHTEAMIDCLTSLSASEIQNIRHIRLKAFAVPLLPKGEPGYYTTFSMPAMLPMFPGLKLDRLVVEDCYHDEGVNDGWGDIGTYYTIERLLEIDGWKELYFTSPTTEFLSSGNDSRNTRVAQPAGWDKLLKGRDGEQSGAEVKMYLATKPNVAGAAEMPQTRMIYDAVPGQIPPGFEMRVKSSADDDYDARDVDAREVLVVAKRGRNASYMQDGSALHKGIKDLVSTMSWLEIKEKKYIPPYDDPCAHL